MTAPWAPTSETHAFGGPEAMDAAHTLFHHDSRHLLDYLQRDPTDRRERSLILCTALIRSAGLDLEEQGDVWSRVEQARASVLTRPPVPDPDIWAGFTDQVRNLILGTVQTIDQWHTAFETTGAALRTLREAGKLTRGLRAVTAKHVIFHWNRIGLPAATQATLAHAGREAILRGPNRSWWFVTFWKMWACCGVVPWVRKGQQPPWIVQDDLWARIEPLLPAPVHRFPNAGRKRLDNRKVLQGILFVLHTGIQWEYLPQQLGFGCGMTCWRRLNEWNRAGVWQRLHRILLAELQGADQLDWSRAAIDASHVRAMRRGPKPVGARSTVAGRAPNTTS